MSRIQRGLENRRTNESRIHEQTVKIHKLQGRVLIQGSGESSINVTFPVTFTTRPGFSFGSEIAENVPPTGGNFPSVTAAVARWDKVEKLPGVFHYNGAVITIVILGNPGYMYVHWHMEGKAFRNPIYNLGTADVWPTD